jgi:hypothetical protein
MHTCSYPRDGGVPAELTIWAASLMTRSHLETERVDLEVLSLYSWVGLGKAREVGLETGPVVVAAAGSVATCGRAEAVVDVERGLVLVDVARGDVPFGRGDVGSRAASEDVGHGGGLFAMHDGGSDGEVVEESALYAANSECSADRGRSFCSA